MLPLYFPLLTSKPEQLYSPGINFPGIVSLGSTPGSLTTLAYGQEQPTVRTEVWSEIGSSLGGMAGATLGLGMDLLIHSMELAILPFLMAAQPRK